MKFENYMILEFPSRSTNEAFARSAVACFAAQLDPTLEELGDIKTAVSEAVTNCIVHAYPDAFGTILLRCRILKDNVLDIVVKDRGVGIADIEKARKPMFTTGGADRSGMGFTIMESFMTSLQITSQPGKGPPYICGGGSSGGAANESDAGRADRPQPCRGPGGGRAADCRKFRPDLVHCPAVFWAGRRSGRPVSAGLPGLFKSRGGL